MGHRARCTSMGTRRESDGLGPTNIQTATCKQTHPLALIYIAGSVMGRGVLAGSLMGGGGSKGLVHPFPTLPVSLSD